VADQRADVAAGEATSIIAPQVGQNTLVTRDRAGIDATPGQGQEHMPPLFRDERQHRRDSTSTAAARQESEDRADDEQRRHAAASIARGADRCSGASSAQ
jgi:hypothetical protein